MNIQIPRRDTRLSPTGSIVGGLAQVVVIHPTTLMRRGLAGIVADSRLCEAGKIVSFETVVQAAATLAKLNAGDVIVMPIEDCAIIERDNAHLFPKGISVAAVGACDLNAVRLFEAGVIDAVITTSVTAEELMRTLAQLASGGRALPKRPPQQRLTGGLGRLSQRQLEILELMTRGLLNKQIAWELGLTEGTVKSHVSAILEKLGCSRRTQAITTFMMSGARDQRAA